MNNQKSGGIKSKSPGSGLTAPGGELNDWFPFSRNIWYFPEDSRKGAGRKALSVRYSISVFVSQYCPLLTFQRNQIVIIKKSNKQKLL